MFSGHLIQNARSNSRFLNLYHYLLNEADDNHDILPYFFGYKTEFFSFQNNPKNLDPSYKTDLDLWDCFGRIKRVL